jgi:heme/copper-type cytochrome/quinol oxidase subunit 4
LCLHLYLHLSKHVMQTINCSNFIFLMFLFIIFCILVINLYYCCYL